MTLTRLRRRRSGMYDVQVLPPPAGDPTFFVAASFCGTLWEYEGESYVSTLAFDTCLDEDYPEVEHVPPQTWVDGSEVEHTIEEGELILSVSPGSVLPLEIHRQRIGENEYSVASGVAASPAAYHGGFLWWVEVTQHLGLVFSLRRSRPDLTEVSTVATETVADPTGGGDLYWIGKGPVAAVAAGPDAVISEWLWRLGSPSGTPAGGIRLRFPLGAGSPESAPLPTAARTFTRAVAAPAGGFLAADGSEVLHTGGSTAIGLTWQADYYAPGSDPRQVSAERLSLGPAGVLGIFGPLTAGHGIAVAPTAGPYASGPSADVYSLDSPPELESPGVGWIRRGGP